MRSSGLRLHLPLAVLAAGLAICVWLLPVLLGGGYPPEMPTVLLSKNYAETGLFQTTDDQGRVLGPQMLKTDGITTTIDGRLSAVLYSRIGPAIGWDNWFGWSVVSAVLMAGALLFFWLFTYKLFDVRTAWVSSLLLALMPMTWRMAVTLSSYQTAFLFLFAALAAYVWIRDRKPVLALIISAILFGLSIASKDVFITFLPWLVLFVLWEQRKRWKRALGLLVLFLAISGVIYTLPYIGDIQREGYPLNQNLARLWPVASPAQESVRDGNYLHLYPDPYTYFQDKADFDAAYLAGLKDKSLIERLQEWKLRVNFGLEAGGIVGFLLSGFWILLNNIPSFFQQALIGSVALWLFIIPGGLEIRKKKPRLFLALGGLIVVTYLIINIVLHYEREHLMDFAWILALAGGVGIVLVSDVIAKAWKMRSLTVIALLSLVLGFQMLQANRFEFARMYAKAPLPVIEAQGQVISSLADSAVIAVPFGLGEMETLALAGERTVVRFHPETIVKLAQERKIAEAFSQYGVTHVLGYDQESLGLIQSQSRIPVLTVADAGERAVSPFLNYLLTIFR